MQLGMPLAAAVVLAGAVTAGFYRENTRYVICSASNDRNSQRTRTYDQDGRAEVFGANIHDEDVIFLKRLAPRIIPQLKFPRDLTVPYCVIAHRCMHRAKRTSRDNENFTGGR
jgi:hypothetical protein